MWAGSSDYYSLDVLEFDCRAGDFPGSRLPLRTRYPTTLPPPSLFRFPTKTCRAVGGYPLWTLLPRCVLLRVRYLWILLTLQFACWWRPPPAYTRAPYSAPYTRTHPRTPLPTVRTRRRIFARRGGLPPFCCCLTLLYALYLLLRAGRTEEVLFNTTPTAFARVCSSPLRGFAPVLLTFCPTWTPPPPFPTPPQPFAHLPYHLPLYPHLFSGDIMPSANITCLSFITFLTRALYLLLCSTTTSPPSHRCGRGSRIHNQLPHLFGDDVLDADWRGGGQETFCPTLRLLPRYQCGGSPCAC